MELPVEIFDEITGLTGAPAPSNESEYERRLHHRFPIGSRATVHPIRNGVEGAGTIVVIRDISLAGIGFLDAEPMKAGDIFNIQFSTEQNRTVRIQCMAQRCESGGCGNTQFIIGATFQTLIEPKDLRQKPVQPEKVPLASLSAIPSAPVAPPKVIAPPPAKGLFTAKPGSIFNLYESADEKPAEEKPVVVAVTVALPTFKETPLPPDDAGHVEAPPQRAPQVELKSEPRPEPKQEIRPAAKPDVQIEIRPEIKREVKPETKPEIKPEAKPDIKPEIKPEAETKMPAPVIPPLKKEPPLPPVEPIVRPAEGHRAARNQEVLAEAKARLHNQSQVLQQKIQQLDELDKLLGEQKAATAAMTRERDELRSQLEQSERTLAEERERNAKQMDVLFNELAALKQAMKILQIKSNADDRAVAELGASLGEDGAADQEKLRSRLIPTGA